MRADSFTGSATMNMPPAYFVVRGFESFDVLNPDWKRVRGINLYNRLTAETKKLVSEALAHHVSVQSMTPEALESIDQYITGINY